jgi:hypothetical protein
MHQVSNPTPLALTGPTSLQSRYVLYSSTTYQGILKFMNHKLVSSTDTGHLGRWRLPQRRRCPALRDREVKCSKSFKARQGWVQSDSPGNSWALRFPNQQYESFLTSYLPWLTSFTRLRTCTVYSAIMTTTATSPWCWCPKRPTSRSRTRTQSSIKS